MKKTLTKLLILVFVLSVMTCFSVGCAHEHAFDKQVTTDDYISREATCLDVAEYFYSCSCGAKGEETFEYGEPLGHDFGAWTSNQNDTHTRVCSRNSEHSETEVCSGGTKTCAEKAVCETCNTEYGTTDPHVFNRDVVSDTYKYRNAGCLTPAKYYYSCVCGAKGEETFDYGEPSGHDWRPWGKAYLASNSHSRSCYRCTDGYETEKCYGGKATCTEKATCEVCDTSYGSALGHSWTAWTSNGDNTHSKVCFNDSKHVETVNCYGGEAPCETKSICEGCNTEYGEIEGHQWKDWVSIGGGQHKRVCSSNSSHTETGKCDGGKATCTERALCDICKNPYGSVLEHKWGAWTSNGDDTHSRVCDNDSKHVETVDCFGGEAPCETKSICEDCKTEYGEVLGHLYGRWYSNGNGTHTRYCLRDNKHTEDGNCAGGTASCTKKAVCETCSGAYGQLEKHKYGEYKHYSNATCVDYAKQRAYCIAEYCYAYLERDDETQPPKGYHEYNIYDNCVDCGTKRETSEGLVYTKLQGDDFYMISNLGDCTDTEIVIQQYVHGYFVTKITDEYGRGVFDYSGGWSSEYKERLAKITKVTIPQTIEYIGKRAFYKLPALETVIIEGDDVVIDEDAFYMCPELKVVILKGENIQIGTYAFYQCTKLEKVEVDGYIGKIGSNAFSGCKLLKDVALKSGLTEISNYAFNGTALESVVIPVSVKTIGNGVFSGCKQLRTAIFNGTVNSFGTSVFSSCSTLTNVKLPNNLNSIPSNTFANCTILTSITIPSGVTSIGTYAFDSTSLVSITIPAGVTKIESYAFRYCYKLYEVVNKSSLTIKTGDYQNGDIARYSVLVHKGNSLVVNQDDFLFITNKGTNYLLGYVGMETEITLPENLNGKDYAIYKYAFNACTPITKITLSEGVLSIGEKAFEKCNAEIFTVKDGANYLGTANNPYYAVISPTSTTIETCVIDNNVKVFADMAFYNCSSLKTINVPSGIKHFGYQAIYNCNSLVYTVKNNIMYLGDENNNYLVVIGVDDTTLSYYFIEEGAKFINTYAFWNCTNATHISIPETVTYIEESAFGFCSKLESIELPSGITKIGYNMFANCTRLKTVNIPEGVTIIEERAFYQCALEEIDLPDGLLSIGDYAFYSCDLKGVEIPEGVTSIGYNAFLECSLKDGVVIPTSVTSIEDECFYRCGYLKAVYYKGSASDWDKITIGSDRDNYLARATKYFYVENAEDLPNDGGNYWHYVDGVPTAW